MPEVNGKKYPYTKVGMKKAAEAKKKMMAKNISVVILSILAATKTT